MAKSKNQPQDGRRHTVPARPNRMEVDLDAIGHNVREVRRIIGSGVRIFAALKANAYGFGVQEVAEAVITAGASGVAMVELKDAVALRRRGFRAPILLYAGVPTSARVAAAVQRYQLMPTIIDCGSAEVYSRHVTRRVRIFIKVNAGLERLGISADAAAECIESIRTLPRLTIRGIYTHLHVPRDGAEPYVAWQFDRFQRVLDELAKRGISIPIRMAASTAVLRLSDRMTLNAVDPGHMLFGLAPPGPTKVACDLRDAFRSLSTVLIQVRPVSRSEFTAQAPFPLRGGMVVGVIPMGIADGMGSVNCGEVLVRGRRARILGRLSLEHTQIDLTDVPDARVGDEVVIIGSQGTERISIDDVTGRRPGMAPAELAVAVRESIPRLYVKESDSKRGRRQIGRATRRGQAMGRR